MGKGWLQVETTTAKGLIVVGEVKVVVVAKNHPFQYTTYTDFEGKTNQIALDTKDRSLTFIKEEIEEPFDKYDVKVEKEGYVPVVIENVEIFDGVLSLLPIALQPATGELPQGSTLSVAEISSNAISSQTMPIQSSMFEEEMPIIPREIAVKLGMPGSNAEIVNVEFPYYIKNVASSEIYPTWPEEALRANIYAIISLTLNRIYTEWYPAQGYPFQITNTTALDQKFVKNREIYGSISVLVDEIFNEYIHRFGYTEPLFAAFCDGKKAQCEGLKQWESVTLAQQGMNALEILRYFYGNDIEILESEQIEDIVESYPNKVLKIGSVGKDVYRMQTYLTRLSFDYPALPTMYPLNGVYDAAMVKVVSEFQRIFNLPISGMIDKKTWYKISFLYTGVKRLGEILSEGLSLSEGSRVLRRELREGSRGHDVYSLQYFLNIISEFVDTVPYVEADSLFGPATKNAVIQFQKTYHLPMTGVVDEETWNQVLLMYDVSVNTIPARDVLLAYGGALLKEGSSGNNIRVIQYYLNNIALKNHSIPFSLADGRYGQKTTAQVKAFQEAYDIPVTGVIDEITWDRIVEIYLELLDVEFYPGFELKLGDHNAYVSVIQALINEIAKIYLSIPVIPVDGYYGQMTRFAVRAFQRQLGLEDTGIVDKRTWDKIFEVSKTTTPMPMAMIYDVVNKRVETQLRRNQR